MKALTQGVGQWDFSAPDWQSLTLYKKIDAHNSTKAKKKYVCLRSADRP